MAPSASLIQLFPTTLTNLSSSRHRPPSQACRKEGWTEVWGVKQYDVKGDDVVNTRLSSKYSTVLPDGCDCIVGGDAPFSKSQVAEDSSHLMKLTQHRPAWLEQIVLRMCHIPHIVQNSSYSACESTGALPSLLDLSYSIPGKASSNNSDDMTGWRKTLNQTEKPILIGRSQPGGFGSCFYDQCKTHTGAESTLPESLPSGSHIIDYLRLLHPEVSDKMVFDHQDMLPYITLIQEKLNYIVLALRYGNDPAWEMVYKPQYVQASLDPNGERLSADDDRASSNSGFKSFFSFWTWYQTYSERALSLHNLLPSKCSMHPSTHNGLALELFRYNDHRYPKSSSSSSHDNFSDEIKMHQQHAFSSHLPSYSGAGGGESGRVNIHRAMEYASAYYTTLEEKLKSSSSLSPYFFGTEKPCYIDAVLFDHLVHSICDVHLVLVLAKHSRLVQYFQRIYETYFGHDYIKSYGGGSVDWIRQNNFTNAKNAFNRIPKSVPSKSTLSPEQVSEMSHAIQLMQELAVQCHQLDEALKDAANSRLESGERAVLDNCHRPIGSILYKYCMSFWEGNATRSVKGDGEVTQPEDNTDESKADDMKRKWKEQMERLERDRRDSDETWVMGVFVAMFATVLLSASSRTK